MKSNLLNNTGNQISLQKTITVIFSIFLFVASGAIIVFLVWSFKGAHDETNRLGTKEFIAMIGILFTFSSLVIALFGIINYFQSAESLKRLADLEIDIQYSSRELIVMQVFLMFLSNAKIMKTTQNSKKVIPYMLHLYRIADTKDVTQDDSTAINQLNTSFIEIINNGGLESGEQILDILKKPSLHRSEYTVCIARLKYYVERYRVLSPD